MSSRRLVDEKHLRSSVMHRLFQRTIPAMLGELFQNSQRAGATDVNMRMQDNSFIYEDNGHGVPQGVDSWWNVLAIASSHWENPDVQSQDPMGLGINALLTAEEVHHVVIYSNGFFIEIDTHRWWNDPDYYNNWEDKVHYAGEGENFGGFGLQVFATDEFLQKVRDALPGSLGSQSWYYSTQDQKFKEMIQSYPALGYDDKLTITLDGNLVYTGIPPSEFLPLIETTYEGNKLIIGFDGISVVRWYGQLILSHSIEVRWGVYFSYYLEVKDGTPLTPLGADRSGISTDAKYRNLEKFITDALFDWAAENDSQMSCDVFMALQQLDSRKLRETSAWFAYTPAIGLDMGNDDEKRSYYEIARYEDENPPTLFDSSIQVWVTKSGTELLELKEEIDVRYAFGISAFIDQLEYFKKLSLDYHVPVNADPYRLPPLKQLHWKLGEAHIDVNEYLSEDIFYMPGEWIATAEDADIEDLKDSEWNAFDPDACLHFFSKKTPHSFLYADWYVIGAKNPIYWLRHKSDVAYRASDYMEGGEGYHESIDRILRGYRSDSVKKDFTIDDLSRYISRCLPSRPKVKILSIEIHYAADANYASGAPGDSIEVVYSDSQWSDPKKMTIRIE